MRAVKRACVGFTLIEVLLALSIITIVVTAGGTVLKNSLKLFHEQDTGLEAAQNARLAAAKAMDIFNRQKDLDVVLKYDSSEQVDVIRGDGGSLLYSLELPAETCELYFEPSSGQLKKIQIESGNRTEQVLADQLQDFRILSYKYESNAVKLLELTVVAQGGYALQTHLRVEKSALY